MHISPEILELVPYKPGKPISETQRELGISQVYKLASNENPTGVSDQVRQALIKEIPNLMRYPDASCHELKQSVAAHFQIDSEWLTFGNGSNEIIDLVIRLFCEPRQSAILTSQHAFIAYKICAQAARVETIESPVTAEYAIDLEKLYETLVESQEKVRLVFIPNPNNPTGTYVTDVALEKFLSQSQGFDNTLIVLDEAYNEFVRAKDYPDSIKLLKKYKNLATIRTFSKVYGLAGLRVGALVARPEWIELVNRIRNPFNVNSLAQVAVMAALKDNEYLKNSQKVNWEGVDFIEQQFRNHGISYLPTQANFVLFDCQKNAQSVFESLLRKGVILRPVAGYGLPTWLRMSVGTQEENELAMKAIIAELRP